MKLLAASLLLPLLHAYVPNSLPPSPSEEENKTKTTEPPLSPEIAPKYSRLESLGYPPEDKVLVAAEGKNSAFYYCRQGIHAIPPEITEGNVRMVAARIHQKVEHALEVAYDQVDYPRMANYYQTDRRVCFYFTNFPDNPPGDCRSDNYCNRDRITEESSDLFRIVTSPYSHYSILNGPAILKDSFMGEETALHEVVHAVRNAYNGAQDPFVEQWCNAHTFLSGVGRKGKEWADKMLTEKNLFHLHEGFGFIAHLVSSYGSSESPLFSFWDLAGRVDKEILNIFKRAYQKDPNGGLDLINQARLNKKAYAHAIASLRPEIDDFDLFEEASKWLVSLHPDAVKKPIFSDLFDASLAVESIKTPDFTKIERELPEYDTEFDYYEFQQSRQEDSLVFKPLEGEYSIAVLRNGTPKIVNPGEPILLNSGKTIMVVLRNPISSSNKWSHKGKYVLSKS